MPTKPPPPTVGEPELFRAMWSIGPPGLEPFTRRSTSTAQRSLLPLAYNTVATVLGMLVTKGLARRFEDEQTRHEFEAIYREDEIRDRLQGT